MRGRLYCLCSGETLLLGEKNSVVDVEVSESEQREGAQGGGAQTAGSAGGILGPRCEPQTAQLCTSPRFLMTKTCKVMKGSVIEEKGVCGL